ncbi:MAG: nucleoside deaminase [Acidovorax sp.]|uniref:nucleoside deaminase n=1 Tax=Acidovorax sp. TaxID=1872122 RepID=UPI0039E5F2FB
MRAQPITALTLAPADGAAEADEHRLRSAIAWACMARARGHRPFGAVITSPDGTVLAEAHGGSADGSDCTAHAEINALRSLSPRLGRDVLAQATLYSSAEPCAMCAGAICWSGIGRVVYGLDTARLRRFRGRSGGQYLLDMPCRDVFATASRPIVCIGPLLIDEAIAPHVGFWKP